MPSLSRIVLAALPALGLSAVIVPASAHAQAADGPRPLGGYGASRIASYYRTGTNPWIPYGATFGGYVPYRGFTGPEPRPGAMRPREIAETPIGGARRARIPIGGASLTGSPRIYTPFGYRGGMAIGRGTPSQATRLAEPSSSPGLGYPFREPPRLGPERGGSAGGM